MTIKTHLANGREVVITNVHTIKEDDTMLILYPPNNEHCAIYVDGAILMLSDIPSFDIRTTDGSTEILK